MKLTPGDKWNGYVNVFQALGSILAFGLLVVGLNNAAEDAKKAFVKTQIDENVTNWVNLQKYFLETWPESAEFYASMHPRHQLPPVVEGVDQVKKAYTESVLCSIIVQTIEDMLLRTPNPKNETLATIH